MVDQIGAATLVERLFAEGVEGVGRADLAMRMQTVDPDRELGQAARLGIRFVIPSDAEWPRQLDDLGQPDTQLRPTETPSPSRSRRLWPTPACR